MREQNSRSARRLPRLVRHGSAEMRGEVTEDVKGIADAVIAVDSSCATGNRSADRVPGDQIEPRKASGFNAEYGLKVRRHQRVGVEYIPIGDDNEAYIAPYIQPTKALILVAQRGFSSSLLFLCP